MEEEFIFEEQNSLIEIVKNSLIEIHQAKTQERTDIKLFNLLSKLFNFSDKVAKKGDYYEAAGRLYSAAYYLEEYHPVESREIYQKAIEYYILSLNIKIKQGAYQDATNVSLKIANIYNEKLQNHEKEVKFLQKAINLIKDQIEILKVGGNLRELCGKYQTLSILYNKIKDYPKVISAAKIALEKGKFIKDYSIISNAYNVIISANELLQKSKDAQNIIYEAMDYFSKEATEYEAKQELIHLSQLYQIIKNLYGNLQNHQKYLKFSRKEAGVYVALAKVGILHNINPSQIASYYRGAALCYKETDEFSVDSASCFLIAGNYYNESEKYTEAAINYEDAAKSFEGLKRYKKAYDLYVSAGNFAITANNLRSAILNYMSAESLYKFIKVDPIKIYVDLVNYLKKLANIEEASKNHYVAGSLYLEAAYYMYKTPRMAKGKEKELLNNSQHNYWIAAKSENEIGKNSMRAYALGLVGTINKYLGDHKKSEKSFQFMKSIKSKIGMRYFSLFQELIKCLDSNEVVQFSEHDSKTMKLLNHENSSELRKLQQIVCKKKQINK